MNPAGPLFIEVNDGDGDLTDMSDNDGGNPVFEAQHSVCVYNSGKVSEMRGLVGVCP